jgi:anaerobic magnesium-protoporphyrin IX monomethyl ester cyclase
MQKILLIYPKKEFNDKIRFPGPPLGLIYLANYLKTKGESVKIIDRNLGEDIDENEIKDSLIIGLSVSSEQIEDALKISERIKKTRKNVYVIWGGSIPTLIPEITIKNRNIDLVCIGPGEKTLFEVIKKLKGNKDLKKIGGLVYKKKNKVIINKKTEVYNINELPEINWDVVDLNKYYVKILMRHSKPFTDLKPHKIFYVRASKGCVNRCTFCIQSKTGKNGNWVKKEPKKVVMEIEQGIKKYDIDWVWFIDDDFFFDRKNVIKICNELLKKNIKISWNASIRINDLNDNKETKEMIAIALKSGLKELDFGVESGSDRILTFLKKKITVQKIKDVVKFIDRYDVSCAYSFMIGLPEETPEDIEQTKEIMIWISKNSQRGFILGPQLYRPYPGTELYDYCINKFKFKVPSSLEEWLIYINEGMKKSSGIGDDTRYLSYKNFKWIDRKKEREIRKMISNMPWATMNIKQLVKKKLYLMAVLSLISKFRLKYNVWLFPYEFKIGLFFNRIIEKSS